MGSNVFFFTVNHIKTNEGQGGGVRAKQGRVVREMQSTCWVGLGCGAVELVLDE